MRNAVLIGMLLFDLVALVALFYAIVDKDFIMGITSFILVLISFVIYRFRNVL